MKRRGFLGKAGAALTAAAAAGLGARAAKADVVPCPSDRLEIRREGRSVWGVWKHDGLSEVAIVTALQTFRKLTGVSATFLNLGHADFVSFMEQIKPQRSYGRNRVIPGATQGLRFVAPGVDAAADLSPALPKGLVTIEGVLPEEKR